MKSWIRVAFWVGLGIAIGMTSCSSYTVRDRLPVLDKYMSVKNNDMPKYFGIIRIKNYKDEFVCTAFVIDGQYAATASHCVVEEKGEGLTHSVMKIFDSNDTDTGVTAIAAAMDTRMDSAIIKGDFKEFQALPADFENYHFLSSKMFMTCGFPFGQKKLLCSPFLPKKIDATSVEGIGALFYGQSGGPVFDAETKQIVGLNSAIGDGYVKIYPLTGFLASMGIQ